MNSSGFMLAVLLKEGIIERLPGTRSEALPATLRQRLGPHKSELHPLVRSYGLQQEFITPHCPQQNGMVERLIRTLKEQCVHRHRFESQRHAMRVIGDCIYFYNHQRPHQALGMRTPAEAFALAA